MTRDLPPSPVTFSYTYSIYTKDIQIYIYAYEKHNFVKVKFQFPHFQEKRNSSRIRHSICSWDEINGKKFFFMYCSILP